MPIRHLCGKPNSEVIMKTKHIKTAIKVSLYVSATNAALSLAATMVACLFMFVHKFQYLVLTEAMNNDMKKLAAMTSVILLISLLSFQFSKGQLDDIEQLQKKRGLTNESDI